MAITIERELDFITMPVTYGDKILKVIKRIDMENLLKRVLVEQYKNTCAIYGNHNPPIQDAFIITELSE